MTPIQRRGRNSKKRGNATERSLVRFLENNGVHAVRANMSGGYTHPENFVGGEQNKNDILIECGKTPIYVEVKSRQKLPSYVVGMRHNKPWPVKNIEHLCYILTDDEFLTMLIDGSLPMSGLRISAARCKQLEDWFKQDDADIVAMKEYGKRHFYFAVKYKTANRIRGRFK